MGTVQFRVDYLDVGIEYDSIWFSKTTSLPTIKEKLSSKLTTNIKMKPLSRGIKLKTRAEGPEPSL